MKRLMYVAVCLLTAACTAPGSPAGSLIGPTGGTAATDLSPNASPKAASHVSTTFIAHLVGANENPARDTLAQGQVILRLSPDGESLSYRLIASNIDNVIASHIHVGAPEANGPIVAFLFGAVPAGGGAQDGVLATGTVTEEDLIGPLLGMTMADLVDAMVSGGTYVNVHTSDGVDPPNEGAGDFPGGEIRGQLEVLAE